MLWTSDNDSGLVVLVLHLVVTVTFAVYLSELSDNVRTVGSHPTRPVVTALLPSGDVKMALPATVLIVVGRGLLKVSVNRTDDNDVSVLVDILHLGVVVAVPVSGTGFLYEPI